MKQNKKNKIDELIGNREYLKSDRLYQKSIEEVKTILEMPEWKDGKFQRLLTSNIWNSNSKDVKAILEMPEWENEKFQGLLTSNIWKSNSKEVKAILEMPEWEDEKFQRLLTSTIWSSNSKEVKTILEMSEWEDKRYKHLLQPSIFKISIKNIRPTIKLFEKYGIEKYISNCALRRNVKQQEILLEYMKTNNIPFLEEDKNGNVKLNKIINASKTKLKKTYGIDLEILKKNNKGKTKEEICR